MSDQTDIRVLAVNAAKPRTLAIGDRMTTTGIFKTPSAAPLRITRDGVEGDVILDTRVHGGVDQAVYVYSAEDAAWWAERLQRQLPPGFFGENVTITRWWSDVRIGDRLRAGDVTLELTAPRSPCAKLATRVGDPQFVKTFASARRPGAYTRVLTTGTLAAGAACTVERGSASFPLLESIVDLLYSRERDARVIRQCLDAPISERMRAACEDWLAASAR